VSYCVHCGKKHYSKAKYCHQCGKPHPKTQELDAKDEAAAATDLEVEEPEQIVRKAVRRRSNTTQPPAGYFGSVIVALLVIVGSILLMGSCGR
jgi:uncharacterized membrane protein YvbJ